MHLISDFKTTIAHASALYGGSELKTRRNRLTRLCGLPAEILIEILIVLICDGLVNDGLASRRNLRPQSGQWTRMMLVCKHIRGVALNTPSLWAFIQFLSDLRPSSHSSSTRWKQLCLERSGQHLLHLRAGVRAYHFGENWEERRDAMQTITSLLSRCSTAELKLDLSSTYDPAHAPELIERLVDNLLETPALHMTRFAMELQGYVVHGSFLGGSCPALRSLALYGLHGISHSPSFPVLQKLEVGSEWIHTSHDMLSLFALLDSAPNICELTINACPYWVPYNSMCLMFPTTPIDEKAIKIPHLPCLDVLRLRDNIERIPMFLRLLPTPARGLHIIVSGDEWCPGNSAMFASVHSYVSSFWTHRTGRPCVPRGTMPRHVPEYPLNDSQYWVWFGSEEVHLASPISCSFGAVCRMDRDHPLRSPTRLRPRDEGDHPHPSHKLNGSGKKPLTVIKRSATVNAWVLGIRRLLAAILSAGLVALLLRMWQNGLSSAVRMRPLNSA